MKLLVNIDHVATLRNARSEGYPDPADAAVICENNGAAGIVFHLSEDRRNIKDADVYKLKKVVKGLLDFEMGASEEMIRICSEVKPELCTLVPEKREEITTEGGLNMEAIFDDYKNRVLPKLADAEVPVSLFVEPDIDDIKLCAKLGVPVVELHTGTFSNAQSDRVKHELKRLKEAAEVAHDLGIQVNAGHGLSFENIEVFLQEVPHLEEISIGHALIADAVFNGLGNTVSRMSKLIASYKNG